MIGSAVAKRYATALYELADEQKLVPKIGNDLGAISAAWGESAELRAVFLNPSFSVEQKRGVIGALAKRLRIHKHLENTLYMLSERRRLPHVPEIAESFQRIAERRGGKVRAEVVTASKLSEAYYARLERTLREATGKDVILVRREDPTLIGGVVTTVGGRVFDGSVKNRLRQLKSQLLRTTDPVQGPAS